MIQRNIFCILFYVLINQLSISDCGSLIEIEFFALQKSAPPPQSQKAILYCSLMYIRDFH